MYCQELKSFKQTKSSVVTKEGLKQQVQDIEETDLKIGSNDVADVNVEETYVNIGCNKVVDKDLPVKFAIDVLSYFLLYLIYTNYIPDLWHRQLKIINQFRNHL